MFLHMYALIDSKECIKIFGHNYLELIGIIGVKPWDCVGTIEECEELMRICQIKSPELHIFKHIKNKTFIENKTIWTQFNNNNNVPFDIINSNIKKLL